MSVDQLVTQTQPIPQTLLDKWLDPDGIITVLSVLTVILFLVTWYLLRLYIKDKEKTQSLLLEMQRRWDEEQKELNLSLLTAVKDSTCAITEIATLVKRLDQWISQLRMGRE